MGIMKQCSKERGCEGKANLGRDYKLQADRLSEKHNKQFGVYMCPHCGGTHLTTKIHKKDEYGGLLYITSNATNETDSAIKRGTKLNGGSSPFGCYERNLK